MDATITLSVLEIDALLEAIEERLPEVAGSFTDTIALLAARTKLRDAKEGNNVI